MGEVKIKSKVVSTGKTMERPIITFDPALSASGEHEFRSTI